MSVLSDLYVSTPDEALRYDETQSAPENERAQLKRLTTLEYSMLWAILEGKPWELSSMKAFEMIMIEDDGERLIYRFPETLVELAGGLDDAAIAAAAEPWANTEEMRCDPEDTKFIIGELRRVARVAKETNRNLYLWISV